MKKRRKKIRTAKERLRKWVESMTEEDAEMVERGLAVIYEIAIDEKL